MGGDCKVFVPAGKRKVYNTTLDKEPINIMGFGENMTMFSPYQQKSILHEHTTGSMQTSSNQFLKASPVSVRH